MTDQRLDTAENVVTKDGRSAGNGGNAEEVFRTFLKLGLTSFGGPIAHLGYFRNELVVRRKWVSEEGYADIVALCQFLPGPASSKVGFALGLLRGGPLGAAAAWTAFTLPSAILLVLFAYASTSMQGPIGEAVIHGLKLVAVAVVAQAIWGMAKALTPDARRAGIAVVALLVTALAPSAFAQVGAILVGGLAGLTLCRQADVPGIAHLPFKVSKAVGLACLALFFGLLFGLPVLAGLSSWHPIDMVDAFYRSGALVFGGGHVVLPLLEAEVVRSGWVDANDFLAGYGAAQAVPGPLFTFAAYLGTIMEPGPNGLAGALLCLVVLFVPGFLLLVGALPFWNELRHRSWAQAALRGTNAAVVGILGAAFYNPVWTSAVLSPLDFALAVSGFVALVAWKAPPWSVVLVLACLGAAGFAFGR